VKARARSVTVAATEGMGGNLAPGSWPPVPTTTTRVPAKANKLSDADSTLAAP
jgi:hypothetical protein